MTQHLHSARPAPHPPLYPMSTLVRERGEATEREDRAHTEDVDPLGQLDGMEHLLYEPHLTWNWGKWPRCGWVGPAQC